MILTRRISCSGRLIVTLLMLAPTVPTAATDNPSEQTGTPRPFSVHDTDGDGYLNREEYQVFYRKLLARHQQTGRPGHRMLDVMRFEEIDADADGRVSADEMVAALQQRRRSPGWRWRNQEDASSPSRQGDSSSGGP